MIEASVFVGPDLSVVRDDSDAGKQDHDHSNGEELNYRPAVAGDKATSEVAVLALLPNYEGRGAGRFDRAGDEILEHLPADGMPGR